jgi:hypothetical protein
MNWKRIFMFVAIAGGLAALVTSAATTGRRQAPLSPPDGSRTKAVETSGAELAAEIERLRERLRPTIPPQQPARNLFQYERRPSSRAVAKPDPVTAPIETPPPPAPPTMTLIGIAEDPGADGVIRTAIISGFGDVFLVKEGESVTSRYKVARISGDVVELSDATDASIIRLALK